MTTASVEATLRERVDAFTKRATEQAPKHWRRSSKSGTSIMPPFARLLLRSGAEVTAPAYDFGADSKLIYERALKKYAKLVDAIAIAFSSEAWMSKEDPKHHRDDLDDFKGVMPRDDPDRVEVLLLAFDTPFAQSMRAWRIDRTGKRAKLVHYVSSDGGGRVDGRFVGVEKVN